LFLFCALCPAFSDAKSSAALRYELTAPIKFIILVLYQKSTIFPRIILQFAEWFAVSRDKTALPALDAIFAPYFFLPGGFAWKAPNYALPTALVCSTH
jgi:hypothetical protein